MGLRWLSMRRGRREESQEAEPVEQLSLVLDRLLFIGFNKSYGFSSFQWTDSRWQNAADFEAIFINVGSLFNLILTWSEQYRSNKDEFSLERFEELYGNLIGLQRQLLHVIDSDRQIFALATPENDLYIRNSAWSHGKSVSVYDWCPLPVHIYKEEGEVSKDVDQRFSEYRRQLKNWIFSFGNKPEVLQHFDRSELLNSHSFVTVIKDVFVNLSQHPLGIELRYGILNQATIGQQPQLETVSGPIYLLHYPIGGNLDEAVRSLVRQFCNTDTRISEEPEWLDSIVPPKGAEIDPQVESLSRQIDELSKRRSELLTQRQQHEVWQKLLYESGNDLESIVLEALKLLGLENVQPGPKGDQDITGEFFGDTFLFEVKGLNGSAGRKEVFSLDRHIDEFEAKNHDRKVSKGVLVVNAYRKLAPALRDAEGRQVFAGDAVKHAKLLEFALLDTRDLYRAVTDAIEGRMTDPSRVFQEFRQTVGVYSYTNS